jgi:protoporphyrinogen oxidase
VGGVRVDHGSHRLHPAADAATLGDLRRLLGDDLQVRPRNGRMKVAGRWVGFPLRTGDLLRSLPPRFAAGAAVDALTGPLRRAGADTFDATLRAGLGPTVVDAFYAPYAEKLWGTPAAGLAGELARKRVSASSPVAVARKVLRGARTEGRVFLYPRRGFGQIVEAVADAAVAAGADLRLGTGVVGVDPDRPAVALDDGSELEAATVLSTLPLTVLAALAGGPDVGLRHRAMLIVWLVVARDRWTPFDAHYLPDPSHPVARVSEPKNYRDSRDDPAGTTVVCAEVPCWEGDELWDAEPAALGQLVAAALAAEGLPPVEPEEVEVARLPRVYPLYEPGFAWEVSRVEAWLAEEAGHRVVTVGRQGLFVPDNTHHVLGMGRAVAACLGPDGTLDPAAWWAARARFRAFVVED